MNDEQIPDGWHVCSFCDGYGYVYEMQATPDMDEAKVPCPNGCSDGLLSDEST